jgi:hypothetical protein
MADLDAFLAATEPRDRADPFTYVVDVAGVLRLAPRRSEHVACAAGGPVLAAGEIAFGPDPAGWAVTEVSNLSTGYCPDPACWPAVVAALDRTGVARPEAFTAAFAYRGCPACHTLNVVKDGDFACGACGADLPATSNIRR